MSDSVARIVGSSLAPIGYDVSIRRDDCVSAGRCVGSAPSYFVFDDDEIANVDRSGLRPDDESLLRIARQCPNGAIDLTLDGEPVEL